ncbi:hypothetical protein QC762_0100550 [Podospora pseudocomata]|uniref:Uncharacterized protein n=1 Tax=Podospora pseudocomata TaxID=2093779 RepID=A0ABR0G8V1_9PEZI|nr:hypothetical protein QC762_0100550 [Podospora pseudocomata]
MLSVLSCLPNNILLKSIAVFPIRVQNKRPGPDNLCDTSLFPLLDMLRFIPSLFPERFDPVLLLKGQHLFLLVFLILSRLFREMAVVSQADCGDITADFIGEVPAVEETVQTGWRGEEA